MSLIKLKSEFKKIESKIHPLLAIAIKEDIIEKPKIKKDVMLGYHQKMSGANDSIIEKEIARLNKRYKKNYKANKKNVTLFKKSYSMILELVK